MKMRAMLVGVGAVAAWAVTAVPAGAVTFVGSEKVGEYTYSAEATFTIQDSYLNILLRNTASQVTDPAQVLTCLFFDVKGIKELTRQDAFLPVGSYVIQDGTVQDAASYNLKQEWAYTGGLSKPNRWGNANFGVGSAGLGVFGSSDNFASAHHSVDGDAFGVVPSGCAATSTNLSGRDFVRDSIVLRLGFSSPVTESDISNVWFQYGSDQDYQRVQAVPEPFTMSAIGAALVAAFLRRKR